MDKNQQPKKSYDMQSMMPDMSYYPMMNGSQMQIPEEDDDGMDEMDMEYMKKIYPEICIKIQFYVDEECDKMEYEGSCIYDEYPDKESIEIIVDKICEKMKKDKVCDIHEEDKNMQRKYYGGNRFFRPLVHSVLSNEVFGRRRRRWRRRRRRYPRHYDGYGYPYGYGCGYGCGCGYPYSCGYPYGYNYYYPYY